MFHLLQLILIVQVQLNHIVDNHLMKDVLIYLELHLPLFLTEDF
jgi:hypothetical protein